MRFVTYCVFVCFVLVFTLPVEAGQDKESSGKVPYDRVCRVCHGPEAQGNQGPALVPFSMELDELIQRIREGGGEMPPISENRLTDDEIKLIAVYLKSLSPPSDPPAADGPRNPPAR